MSRIGTTEFYFEVAKGNVAGTASVNKFGTNETVGTSFEDIWTRGGEYTYLAAASQLFVSSDDAQDAVSIQVQGLDANGAVQTASATLSGQSQQSLAGTWLRVFRAFNGNSTDLSGNVYIASSGALAGGVPTATSTIMAQIGADIQQTEMTHYTVPSGHKGYIIDSYANVGKGDDAEIHLMVRESGAVFRVRHDNSVYQASEQFHFNAPNQLPALADVKIRGKASAGNIDCHAGYTIITVAD